MYTSIAFETSTDQCLATHVATSSSSTGQKHQKIASQGANQDAMREGGEEEYALDSHEFLVCSLNLTCVSLIVARCSYIDSKSSRRSSSSCVSKLSSRSTTAAARESVSSSKAVIKSGSRVSFVQSLCFVCHVSSIACHVC